MYDSKYSFSNYKNVAKYYNLSFTTKYVNLLSFYHRLNEFRNLVSLDQKKQKLKKRVCIEILQLYIEHCKPSILMITIILRLIKK